MLPTPCHCIRLRRAARTATRLYDQALAPVGLKVTQFSLLRTVARLKQPSISSLASATGLERSTLGRNLRPLEKLELITLSGSEDLRMRRVELTDRGRSKLAEGAHYWAEAQARFEATLGTEGRTQLEQLLDTLVEDGLNPRSRNP